MGKQIQLRIYPDGKIEAKTLGIKGKKCVDYIQVLEQMLKAKTVESAYTEEYNQVEDLELDNEIIITNKLKG